LDRLQRPLFRRGEGRVDEGFTQIDFAAVAEILREPLQQSVKTTGALPELKSAMDGLIRRIPARQVRPRRTGAEHPERRVHDVARLRPRPATPIGAAPRTEDRLEHGPLLVGEVHAAEYDGDRNVVHRPRLGFMR
jgi:hypothetical protein